MILFATLVNHAVRWHATEFHDEFKLLLFVVSREDWLTGVQLRQDTAKTPNVYFFCVLYSKNNLWRSIKSRLHICVDLFVSEAPGAEVDDFEISAHSVCTENVFRLKITVNNFVLLQEN